MLTIFILKTLSENIRGQETKTYQLFVVPIGNAKTPENIYFLPEAPVLQYHQQSSNSCCLGSLSSAFYIIGDNRNTTDLANSIE